MPAAKNRIRFLRNKSKVSQMELAQELYIDQSTLCCYENGTRDIPSQILIQIAEIFGVSVDYVIGFDKYKSDQSNISPDTIKRQIDLMNDSQLHQIKGYRIPFRRNGNHCKRCSRRIYIYTDCFHNYLPSDRAGERISKRYLCAEHQHQKDTLLKLPLG